MRTMGIMGVMLMALAAGAQMPPAPPGFVSQHTRAIRSPKHMAGRSGARMIRPPLPEIAVPLTIPTNHAPPVASIEWHQVIGGPYGVADAGLTNVVLYSIERVGNEYLNFKHMGVGGKTYELQVNFGFPDTNWWSYTHCVMPRDDILTTGHPIYANEKQRFFRVRSN